jgi:tetratricopeptide (TPR) repeat protein
MNPTSFASVMTALVLLETGSVSDKPIEAYRNDLLDLAFKAAAAMPVHPHHKNRSKAQESVVDACFELEQPQRALGYVEKIEDWRRGLGYAGFAFYSAQRGETGEVQHYLDLARKISDQHAEDEDSQDWQQERIRATIAKTLFLIGQREEASRIQGELTPSESSQVNVVRATRSDADAFEQRLKAVDATVAAGGFDQLRCELETCAQLFDRFYDDGDRRARVEEKIKTAFVKLPVQIQFDLMTELVGHALEHKDRPKALALVNETQTVMDEAQWLPEDKVRLTARLAGLRYRADDTEKARTEADRALLFFDAARGQIVDIWRAGALRAVAEAYQAMGDAPAALKVYKKAVEEGVGNPNSRPRAEDLTATCCSMALHGVEPDESLRARLVQVCDGLGSPW